ncbi:MAG: trehalose-6-phosphate synthase [Actinomycetota bacterium]|nr:trehalose-6-phosphate synthase [Actinomycetota bacterium]
MTDPAEVAGDDPIIIVSNRGPVEHVRQDDERIAKRGKGGLVTALSGLAGHLDDAAWVCAAMNDEDVAVAREHDGKSFEAAGDGPALSVRMLELDPDVQHKFYAVIANPLLWFIQHYLWDLSNRPDLRRREHDAFDNGYVRVNGIFADAVAEEVEARGGRATVMVQDYHFYLVPERVRSRCPDVFLQHFVHIPWPHPEAWRVLPPPMRETVFNGVLGNDIVGFHSKRYARNFVHGCDALLGLDVDYGELTVRVGERTVAARWYPISIDPEELDAKAASSGVAEHERDLQERRPEHLVVRADRADPSKNIVRGFRAFDQMLEDHPELTERVVFAALIQRSREDVPEYIDYLAAIRREVDEVNGKHGTEDWTPVELNLEGDFDEVVAAYKHFDVLVVNALADGMNLVAKEGMLVNQEGGVLALSENAGAYEELGEWAVTLHPFDVQQQADAMFEALTMDGDERRRRLAACADVVRKNDVAKWLRDQLRDVADLRR